MTQNIIYLVTGANRGIGLGICKSLLLRPHTTVIATARSVDVFTGLADFTSIPCHPTSGYFHAALNFSTLETTNTTCAALLAETQGNGSLGSIERIDIVIANAGLGTDFMPSLTTPLESIQQHFEVNTLGPIALFQSLYHLLRMSPNPKFVLISSSLGSIAAMEGGAPSLAYDNVCVLAVHPGWVKTANGQNFADSIGYASPPMMLEESVDGVLKQIDGATRENNSGTFVSYDGTIIPW